MTHWIDVTAQVQTIHRALNSMNIQKLKSKSVWSISSQLSEWLPSLKKKDKKIKYCKEYFYTSLQTCSWNVHVPSGACHPAKPSLPGILAFPGACKEYGDGGKFWRLNWEEVVNWSKNKIQIKEKGNSRFAVQILVGHRDKLRLIDSGFPYTLYAGSQGRHSAHCHCDKLPEAINLEEGKVCFGS